MGEQQPDLTTPEAVATGQEVYDQLPTLQPGTVGRELDKAYGIDED
ncbi:hypothetical protein [Streptomyces sp. NBC_00140]|nr:hypothetical protein [Streptomyces sp. NBC_00140]MCX5336897.1 hypothetical protein [Streptomyces sp. NBC_00140]MCX5338380.1 hypothetical protein [Streptomyces sp. NBC_00140]